jgi:hypothetical protein
VIQEGDLIHAIMREDDTARVEAAFAGAPEEQ